LAPTDRRPVDRGSQHTPRVTCRGLQEPSARDCDGRWTSASSGESASEPRIRERSTLRHGTSDHSRELGAAQHATLRLPRLTR